MKIEKLRKQDLHLGYIEPEEVLLKKINEIIAKLNIFIQEREHYCKVYKEVVEPMMLPDKRNLYTSIGEMKIPAYINGIGDCIVYAKCAKCRDNFQIDKPKTGKIVIYCPCCGKVLDYKRI